MIVVTVQCEGREREIEITDEEIAGMDLAEVESYIEEQARETALQMVEWTYEVHRPDGDDQEEEA